MVSKPIVLCFSLFFFGFVPYVANFSGLSVFSSVYLPVSNSVAKMTPCYLPVFNDDAKMTSFSKESSSLTAFKYFSAF